MQARAFEGCVERVLRGIAWMVVFMPGETTSMAWGEKRRLSRNLVVVAPAFHIDFSCALALSDIHPAARVRLLQKFFLLGLMADQCAHAQGMQLECTA